MNLDQISDQLYQLIGSGNANVDFVQAPASNPGKSVWCVLSNGKQVTATPAQRLDGGRCLMITTSDNKRYLLPLNRTDAARDTHVELSRTNKQQVEESTKESPYIAYTYWGVAYQPQNNYYCPYVPPPPVDPGTPSPLPPPDPSEPDENRVWACNNHGGASGTRGFTPLLSPYGGMPPGIVLDSYMNPRLDSNSDYFPQNAQINYCYQVQACVFTRSPYLVSQGALGGLPTANNVYKSVYDPTITGSFWLVVFFSYYVDSVTDRFTVYDSGTIWLAIGYNGVNFPPNTGLWDVSRAPGSYKLVGNGNAPRTDDILNGPWVLVQGTIPGQPVIPTVPKEPGSDLPDPKTQKTKELWIGGTIFRTGVKIKEFSYAEPLEPPTLIYLNKTQVLVILRYGYAHNDGYKPADYANKPRSVRCSVDYFIVEQRGVKASFTRHFSWPSGMDYPTGANYHAFRASFLFATQYASKEAPLFLHPMSAAFEMTQDEAKLSANILPSLSTGNWTYFNSTACRMMNSKNKSVWLVEPNRNPENEFNDWKAFCNASYTKNEKFGDMKNTNIPFTLRYFKLTGNAQFDNTKADTLTNPSFVLTEDKTKRIKNIKNVGGGIKSTVMKDASKYDFSDSLHAQILSVVGTVF